MLTQLYKRLALVSLRARIIYEQIILQHNLPIEKEKKCDKIWNLGKSSVDFTVNNNNTLEHYVISSTFGYFIT